MNLSLIKRVIQIDEKNNKLIRGTCFFIDAYTAITARHVVKNKKNIYVNISEDDIRSVNVKYSEDESMDIAILKLEKEYLLDKYFILNSTAIFENEEWETFGYPSSRVEGKKLKGNVSVPDVDEKKLYDLEVDINPNPDLKNYEGISGAPIIIDDTVEAIVKYKTDGASLGAIKIKNCEKFLENNNVLFQKNYSNWINKLTKSSINTSNSQFILKRVELLQDLIEYCIKDCGVIVGRAGIGKSYIFNELRRELNQKGFPTICTSINEFIEIESDEFKEKFCLKEKENFVNKLQREVEKLASKKIIILFDSYDSIKDEVIKEKFLRKIKQIKDVLGERCNIIVSCRIYDARLSQKLLDLFPNKEGRNGDPEIRCRSYIVSELSDEEVIDAIIQITGNKESYKLLSQNLNEILKVPFNLWLFEDIFKRSSSMSIFKSMNTELELLDEFWYRRINREDKEFIEEVLYQILIMMIKNRTTLINRRDFKACNVKEEWTKILSLSIITYSDSIKRKIMFSHNILFDYAVSKLVLMNKIDEINDFIDNDKIMIIYLRPSFIYFFDSLWKQEKAEFWEITFKALENPELSNIIKLIPMTTIISRIESINELDVLIQKWNENNNEGKELIKGILQYIEVFGDIDNIVWLEFISNLVDNMDSNFLGLISNVVLKIVNKNLEEQNNDVLEKCNKILIKIYYFMKGIEEPSNKEWLNQIRKILIIPGICKTYFINIFESCPLLKGIMDSINENGDNVEEIYAVTENIIYLYKYDFNFTQYIYNKVFSSNVKSDTVTQIGGSAVLNFTSTRKQDYDMCKFNLYNEFNRFIKIDNKNGILLGINTLNIIIKNKIGVSRMDNKVFVEFNGKLVTLIEDYSHCWSCTYVDEEIGEICNAIFEYLNQQVINNNDDEIKKFFNTYIENIHVTYLLAQLLLKAAQKPSVFKDILFDICDSDDALLCLDLIYELAEYIKSCSAYFSNENINKLEKKIISLSDGHDDKYPKRIELIQKRFINCINEEQLILEKSLKLVKEIKEESIDYNNEPLMKFTVKDIPRNYEYELKKRSIVFSGYETKKLLKELDEINQRILNKEADKETIDKTLIIGRKLYDTLINFQDNFELNQEIIRQLSKGLLKALESSDLEFIRCNYEFYKNFSLFSLENYKVDNYDENFDSFSSGYFSTPLHDISYIILKIIKVIKDKILFEKLKFLLNNTYKSIKCIIICNINDLYNNEEDYMWKVLSESALSEEKRIKEILYVPLYNLLNINPEKTMEVVRLVYDENDIKFLNSVIPIILHEAFKRNDEWSANIMKKIGNEPWKYKSDGQNGFLITAFNYISYNNLKYQSNDVIERVTNFIMDVVKSLMSKIIELASLGNKKADDYENMYRIFFFLLDNMYYKSYIFNKSKNIKLDLEIDKKYYFNIKQILSTVIEEVSIKDELIISAKSIDNIIKLLDSTLDYDFEYIVNLMEKIFKEGKRVGYIKDSFADRQLVKFMNKIFADYRFKLQDDDVLQNVLSILEYFSEVGNQDAIKFLWDLNKIYR